MRSQSIHFLTAAKFAICAVAAAVVSTGSAWAATIGVNFDASNAPDMVAPTDNPGIVAGDDWNNVSGSSGGPIVLQDDSATPTTASLSFTAGFQFAGFGTPATGNAGTNTMYSGGIGGASAAAEASITVSSIPYAQYDIYVFASQDTTNTSELSITDGTTTYYYRGAGAGNAGVGSLLQTTSTTSGSPTVGPAQYQLFSGLSSSSFTLDTGGSVGGALSNNVFGFHIVDTTPVPAPEPSTLLLATLGLMGLALGSRRRNRA